MEALELGQVPKSGRRQHHPMVHGRVPSNHAFLGPNFAVFWKQLACEKYCSSQNCYTQGTDFTGPGPGQRSYHNFTTKHPATSFFFSGKKGYINHATSCTHYIVTQAPDRVTQQRELNLWITGLSPASVLYILLSLLVTVKNYVYIYT